MRLCDDCGDMKPGPFYEDPRQPPIEEGKCMCRDCTISALYEVIEENETRLRDHKAELHEIEGGGNPSRPSPPAFDADTPEGFAEQTKVDAEAEADAKLTAREVVARFMLDNGFATGHGDSLYDLLRELEWQVNELKRVREPIRVTHAPTCGYWVDENCTCQEPKP